VIVATAGGLADAWTNRRYKPEDVWGFMPVKKLTMPANTNAVDFFTNAKRDPDNDLLAYFPNRRLRAEELRDAILHVTGELNPALGCLPIIPEINMEVALQPRMIQFSLAPAYQPSPTPAERSRRSIYAYHVRGQADPFLEVFNLPNPTESCDLRDSAAVSPQAFTMMNSDLITDRSIALALRVEKEAGNIERQVTRAFQLTLNRAPTANEDKRMTAYLREMQDYLERAHTKRIRSVDRGMAALIRDLKQRGMLDDTLVIWTGEFVRTPDNNKRGGVYSLVRGHNNKAMTMLFAGGGVKKGSIVGATDEIGASAVECVHPIRDLHVTLLQLLGLDDNKLTYYHAGRYKQLNQFGGQVIKELIA